MENQHNYASPLFSSLTPEEEKDLLLHDSRQHPTDLVYHYRTYGSGAFPADPFALLEDPFNDYMAELLDMDDAAPAADEAGAEGKAGIRKEEEAHLRRKSNYLNFMYKQVMWVCGVLEQPVTVKMDGELCRLTHPHTGNPLRWGDILCDRSAPAFNTYGHYHRGAGYLPGIDESRLRAIKAHKERVDRRAEAMGYPIPDREHRWMIGAALANFLHQGATQRVLNDHDMHALETPLLHDAIDAACEKRYGTPLPKTLKQEVCDTLWTAGGELKWKNVLHAEAFGTGMNDYTNLHKAGMHEPGESYFHPLLALPCDMKLYTQYGIGFVGEDDIFEVRTDGCMAGEKRRYPVMEFKSSATSEIITDDPTCFPELYSKSCIDRHFLENLRSAIGEDAVHNALSEQREHCFDATRLFHVLTREQREKARPLLDDYGRDVQFAQDAMLFEEAANKEALSFLQRMEGEKGMGKCVGNISDIAELLAGLQEKRRSDDPQTAKHAALHGHMAELTFMLRLMAFGLTEADAMHIDDLTRETRPGAGVINAATFTGHLGGKIYHGPLRDAIWPNDEARSEARLQAYRKGVAPLYAQVRSHAAFYGKAESMRAAYAGLLAADAAWEAAMASAVDVSSWRSMTEARTNREKAHWQYNLQYMVVREELAGWLEERPELRDALRETAGPSGIEYFTEKMAQLAESCIIFDARRNMLQENRNTRSRNAGAADLVYAKPHGITRTGCWTDMVDAQRNRLQAMCEGNQRRGETAARVGAEEITGTSLLKSADRVMAR